jgi:hypothetical protein
MSFDFLVAGVGKLSPDSLAGNVARQGVQLESRLKPLLAGHRPIAFDLMLEGCF